MNTSRKRARKRCEQAKERARQSQQDELDRFSTGFVSVLREPGQRPRVLRCRHARNPPTAEESARHISELRSLVSAFVASEAAPPAAEEIQLDE